MLPPSKLHGCMKAWRNRTIVTQALWLVALITCLLLCFLRLVSSWMPLQTCGYLVQCLDVHCASALPPSALSSAFVECAHRCDLNNSALAGFTNQPCNQVSAALDISSQTQTHSQCELLCLYGFTKERSNQASATSDAQCRTRIFAHSAGFHRWLFS